MVWDNGPAYRGEAVREFLRTPGLDLRLVALPAYSPDYNADELVWKWVQEEVTASTCFGTAARAAAAVRQFFRCLDDRREEVMQRCRSELQTAAFRRPPSIPSGENDACKLAVRVTRTLPSRCSFQLAFALGIRPINEPDLRKASRIGNIERECISHTPSFVPALRGRQGSPRQARPCCRHVSNKYDESIY